MDVTRAAGGVGLQTVNDAQVKDQETKNAINQFQARYGEKPKEARTVKKQLDKDDFMRIMITEMKHQDPTKPMDTDRMATQMAQVTSVEQMKNVAQAVDRLAEKSNASDRLAMSNMIGKTVTVDKGRFVHQKGTISAINFDLPEDADKVKLSIQNEKGEEIASRELEPQKAGANTYNWDGINSSNIQSVTGNYIVRVEAENAKGNKIKVDPISKESVVGVTFEGGETNFLVGDPKNPQKVNFKNVARIEGEATMKADAEQKAAKHAAKAAGGPNATTDGAFDLPPGLQEKLKAEMAKTGGGVAAADEGSIAGPKAPQANQAQAAQAKAVAENDHSPGFPNGLRD